MGEAEELCDRIGIIVDGEIIDMDTAEGLKKKYQTGIELPTLEDVFMAATGVALGDAAFEQEEELVEA
jgi:ABC-type multidrug transport system ATPase subunit